MDITPGARIFRFEVPVDDAIHVITCGEVLHVASRNPMKVEFWTTDRNMVSKAFTVVGTGHEIQSDCVFRGTALTAVGLVWHLLELL